MDENLAILRLLLLDNNNNNNNNNTSFFPGKDASYEEERKTREKRRNLPRSRTILAFVAAIAFRRRSNRFSRSKIEFRNRSSADA